MPPCRVHQRVASNIALFSACCLALSPAACSNSGGPKDGGFRDHAATDVSAQGDRALPRDAPADRLADYPRADRFMSDTMQPKPFCLACVQVRVGRPLVARGPAADELDNGFSVVPLPSGKWRGFSANGSSYAIDGAEPWSMGGARSKILDLGPPGSLSECGQWLNDTQLINGVLHGLIHWESACDYPAGQTHKTMAYGRSTDYGLTWQVLGPIISSAKGPQPGQHTGEGDCQLVSGGDGFVYAYCLRPADNAYIVARAPAGQLGPGHWTKYFNGGWSEPGVGGRATNLGFFGLAAGRWLSENQVFVLTEDRWFKGLRLSFSDDKVSFRSLDEPLIPLDDTQWMRPDPTELLAYPSVNSPKDGSSTVDGSFLLAHVYLEPGATFAERYLVIRDVTLWMSPSPASPQVGIALSRWHNAAQEDRWATTAPVVSNFVSYTFDKALGYVLTKAHATLATDKLEDCVSSWPGHPDHLLSVDGSCEAAGYTRLRTAGWVFKAAQANTSPLYRCYNATTQNHFASTRADCEGFGSKEQLLGYLLDN